MAGSKPGEQDLLDKTVAFLAKRDGIDKTLKIIRYTSRLLLATALRGQPDSELALRLRRFEGSIGTSRKAYRLGKFLGDVNALRKTRLHAPYAALEWVAAGGECVYYFVDQLIWLVKAGMLPSRHSASLSKVSAWGELVGYVGSISLSLLRISLLLEREMALLAELQRQGRERAARRWLAQQARGHEQTSTAAAPAAPSGAAPGNTAAIEATVTGRAAVAADTAGAAAAGAAGTAGTAGREDPDEGGGSAKALATEIQLLRARRYLRTMGLVQDLADLLMVLPEVRQKGSKPPTRLGAVMASPAVLNLAGLLSGCLSAYKNWPGTQR